MNLTIEPNDKHTFENIFVNVLATNVWHDQTLPAFI